MNYQELIAKTLEGRTVYQLSKLWGVGQPRLHGYMKGERVPDFDTAWKMVKLTGVDAAEAFEAIAEEERSHKSKQFRLQMGFVQIELLLCIATVGVWPLLYYVKYVWHARLLKSANRCEALPPPLSSSARIAPCTGTRRQFREHGPGSATAFDGLRFCARCPLFRRHGCRGFKTLLEGVQG